MHKYFIYILLTLGLLINKPNNQQPTKHTSITKKKVITGMIIFAAVCYVISNYIPIRFEPTNNQKSISCNDEVDDQSTYLFHTVDQNQYFLFPVENFSKSGENITVTLPTYKNKGEKSLLSFEVTNHNGDSQEAKDDVIALVERAVKDHLESCNTHMTKGNYLKYMTCQSQHTYNITVKALFNPNETHSGIARFSQKDLLQKIPGSNENVFSKEGYLPNLSKDWFMQCNIRLTKWIEN